MNWDKAKTTLILFLLCLNIFLFGMHFLYEDDYVVLREDLQTIATILARSGISLDIAYVDVPSSFPPVDQLNLEPAVYSTSRLVDAFFTDTSNITQTIEFGNPIFSSSEGTLTIMRHIVRFEPSQYSPGHPFDTTTFPLRPGDNPLAQFVQENTDLFPGFVLDYTCYRGENIIIEYRQNYRGYTILPNLLSFSVSATGVTEVLYIFYPPEGFAGVRQPIISPTQALFMFKLGSAHIDEHIAITYIDLVLNIVFAEDEFGRITTAPYYRIFYNLGEQMLINAITGDIE